MNDSDPRKDSGVPQLRTLLLTDLCDSTALVERLGDGAAADLFREHDRLVLELQQRWRGRLIDRSDGLLLLFERPHDGLGFALDYVRGLRTIGESRKLTLQARSGLHVGELLTWHNSDEAVQVGAKPIEVEGLAKPMAGRLMQLARAGQILMSSTAEPLMHRSARELGERGEHLLWKSYGRWRFKGVPNGQEVYEVGEPGFAPLRAPKNGAKAWRDIPLWRRPAALAAEVLLVIGLGTGAWFLTRPQPAIAFAERDWVVVGDLRNLTGQPVLDESLEQAFRISLEQSRYVNVLSDMKARDTLARMQRKPGTTLDRAVASEIAIRDGVRAVILPTVSEVGGRVRVSAEVIDPHTQTTVYAESADGAGIGSALGSIDEVTGALRGKLGEALQSIEKDSEPLPQVSTSNLDALRAYALGVRKYASNQRQEALQYFQRATELDPQFALAYLGALRVYASAGDNHSAKPYLAQALANRKRLAPRDALYLDAWSAEFSPQPTRLAPEKWKLLAGLYPDYYAGHANYAWAEFVARRYQTALKSAEAATAPQNPLRGFAFDSVGRIQLAQERYTAALASFGQAETYGKTGPTRQRAAALAAMRRHEEARAVLAKTASRSPAGDDLVNQHERIAMAVDQGRWNEASRVAALAAVAARGDSPLLAANFRLIDLSVRNLRDPSGLTFASFDTAFRMALKAASDPEDADRADQVFFALTALYMAQRQGDYAGVERALPRISPLVAEIADRNAELLLQIVLAGQSRLSGKAPEAVAQLRALANGQEPFQARVALRDALRASGRDAEALREDRWLVAHRGRAYVEPGGAGVLVLQTTNVADTILAHLDAAELLQHMGRGDEARQEAEAFRRAWPEAERPDYLRRRLASILPASKQ